MGTTLNSSPNALSSKVSKSKPKASTVLALGVVAALLGGVFVAPASAKTSVEGGQKACKAAFQAQTPAPASVRLDANGTRAQTDTLIYAYKVKSAGADTVTTVVCTVDRATNASTLTMDTAQPATTLAAR